MRRELSPKLPVLSNFLLELLLRLGRLESFSLDISNTSYGFSLSSSKQATDLFLRALADLMF